MELFVERILKCGNMLYMKEETEDENDLDEITKFNEASGSFDFLADEPDIYTIKDLKKVYLKPTCYKADLDL